MDLRPTLEALGVDSLANLTLEELEGRIQAVGPSKYHTLQTCMGWLNEHTKNDIQQDLSHFVWMLLQQFGESEIKAVFEKWQKKDAEENPTNRRRYLLVKDEIFGLLKHMRIASNMVAGSSSGPSYLHREYSDTQDPIEDPVGLSLSDIHQMVFNKKNNKENRNKDLGKMLEENIVPTERESDYSVALKETRQPNIPPRASPRGYYVCKRCDRPGHWLTSCPTLLDPAFDQAPEPDYICMICRAVGKHFITLCPRNKKASSWTQKRLQAKGRARSPVLYSPVSNSGRPFTSPHRGWPTGSSRFIERDTRGASSISLSPKWDHGRIPRRPRSDKYYGLDLEDRYGPKKPRYRSSSPFHSPLRSARERIVQKAKEGRLAYDDDVYVSPSQQRSDPLVSSPAVVVNEKGREGEVRKGEPPVVKDMPKEILDETERAKKDTDEFLGDLAKDFPPSKYSSKIVAFLDTCSKAKIRERAQRVKAAEFLD